MLRLATLALAASVSVATADQRLMYIKSSNPDVDGRSLTFIHEGAGINYGFASQSTDTTELTYDAEQGYLTEPMPGDAEYTMYFTMLENYVAMAITGSSGVISFDGETLLFNGTSDGFYACMNTGDPYRYSQTSYELMYYKNKNYPAACIPVTVVGKTAAASGASSGASTASSAVASSLVGTESSVESQVSKVQVATSADISSASVSPAASSHVTPVSSAITSSVAITSVSSKLSSRASSSFSSFSSEASASASASSSSSSVASVSSISSTAKGAAARHEVGAGIALLGLAALI